MCIPVSNSSSFVRVQSIICIVPVFVLVFLPFHKIAPFASRYLTQNAREETNFKQTCVLALPNPKRTSNFVSAENRCNKKSANSRKTKLGDTSVINMQLMVTFVLQRNLHQTATKYRKHSELRFRVKHTQRMPKPEFWQNQLGSKVKAFSGNAQNLSKINPLENTFQRRTVPRVGRLKPLFL